MSNTMTSLSREYDSIALEDASIHTNLQSSASDIRSYFKPWNEAIKDLEYEITYDNGSPKKRQPVQINKEYDSCFLSCLYMLKRCLDYILCKNGFYKIKDHDVCQDVCQDGCEK